MEITAQLVKELREKSGAGMMECKKALSESQGDIDGAIEYLRKAGLQALSKKAGRVASDGLVLAKLAGNKQDAVLLELNCETDFVAKSDDFINFANTIAETILAKKPSSVDELLSLSTGKGQTVSEELNSLVAKIGEKITLRRFVFLKASSGQALGSYIHTGNKIGVIIALEGTSVDDAVVKDLAMHVAAASPQYLKREDVPQTVLDKEKEIYKEQMKDQNKPAEMLEKILEGKIAKFAKEICLIDQIFIKDPTGKKTITQVLKEINPALQIASFSRYQVGEGIEKKESNFADEVAAMAK